jgi:ABC-type multidrug transport system fused ATPase/permease subunit
LYRGENPVLLDVSYTIPAGKKIAIIGPSGTGKSTLFNILLRFLTPSAGQVKVDGVELHQFDLGFLRRKIALVDQMPQLISATVAENIAFSALDEEPINAQAAAEAAEKAGAIEFIQQLEQQFSEELAIGSDHDLSGGQKQRLAIARAFYKDAPIMLFDEPTSALDEASRNKVIEAIKNVHGKTILLVTHDMNVLAAVDQVVVLKDHKLVPVEEVGGLGVYMQHLESEEGASGVDPDVSMDALQLSEVVSTEEVSAPETVPPQAPSAPAQADATAPVLVPEPVVEKRDDGIEISLH